MSPVKNLKNIKAKVWIPPIYTANWRLTVERSDGTIDDITDLIHMFRIEDGVTSGIGIFEFELWNPNETYTSIWTGMEIIRYYSDYASGTPTTLRFRGRIEKVSKHNSKVRVTGRNEAVFVQDQTVTKVYSSSDVGLIIKDLFDTYGQSRYDTSSINVSTGNTLTIEFVDRPFWDAIEDICNSASYDCYIDANLVIQFFAEGTVFNTTDAIVHELNLVKVGDFAPDLQFVRNKIRIYGATIEGVQIIYTANDITSQTTNGIRREIIADDNITNFTQAQELGDFLLAEKKDPPIVGNIKGILLATIQPGEMIRLSSPIDGLTPGYYRCLKYIHEFGDNGLFTIITINKEPRKFSHVMKDRIQSENKLKDNTRNPNDLDFSSIELYNSDTGTHSSTEIIHGVLKVQTGSGSGNWISTIVNTPNSNDINQVNVRLFGDEIAKPTVEISGDGGVNYQTVSLNTLTTLSSAKGSQLRVKLTLDAETIEIDSYEVQYNTD